MATEIQAAVLHEFEQPLVVERLELDPPKAGRLRLEPLITTCGLQDVNDAFVRMQAGETARSVIVY